QMMQFFKLDESGHVEMHGAPAQHAAPVQKPKPAAKAKPKANGHGASHALADRKLIAASGNGHANGAGDREWEEF
ncbi:MAG: hypothetical protein K2Q01_08575, partial [Rickettsiales bacterium]|nr:hypothetical protein [Rickettsiales bacterium]